MHVMGELRLVNAAGGRCVLGLISVMYTRNLELFLLSI